MNKKGSYTCIFGGGAVRGVAYVGALQALDECGIDIDVLAGSSVGSLVATLVAVGYSADEIKKIFEKVNFELFRDIHFGINKDFAISKGNVFTDWVRELIEQKFYGDEYKKGNNEPVLFRDIKKKLVLITTDLNTFKPYELSTFETPDFEIAEAVRASCS
ncbi:patatin-like phospholipase family protein, partial [bacterium]|nr:patatin-like phospholipase family protein [bacterium]